MDPILETIQLCHIQFRRNDRFIKSCIVFAWQAYYSFQVFPPLELVVCFSALRHRLHVFPRLVSTAGDFPRLEPVASFPALGIDCRRFPALGTCCKFSRAWYRLQEISRAWNLLHVFPRLVSTAGDFPRLEPVASFPALGSDYVIRLYYYKKIPLVVALHVSIYFKRVLKYEENRIKTFHYHLFHLKLGQRLPQICYDSLSWSHRSEVLILVSQQWNTVDIFHSKKLDR